MTSATEHCCGLQYGPTSQKASSPSL
uniref:Uncharacterized protein n=1 Tax=Anguilla anguilla TaxID=7936 RepID=A0A0E9UTI1_ANGAN